MYKFLTTFEENETTTKLSKLLNFGLTVIKNYVKYYEKVNKASQAIQSPRTVPVFLPISLLDGYSFANVHVKGIVAFKH